VDAKTLPVSIQNSARIVGFRPESTFLVSGPRQAPGGESIRMGVGRVTLVEPLGSTTYVHVRMKDGMVVSEISGSTAQIPKWDTEAEIWVDPKTLFFFSENGTSIS